MLSMEKSWSLRRLFSIDNINFNMVGYGLVTYTAWGLCLIWKTANFAATA